MALGLIEPGTSIHRVSPPSDATTPIRHDGFRPPTLGYRIAVSRGYRSAVVLTRTYSFMPSVSTCQ